MTTPTRAEYRRRFADLDTSNVADVLDEMGIFDQGLDPSFAPYPAGSAKLAGFAYTIRGQMTPFPMGGDAEKMRACQGIADDEVSVWAGDGEGTCYFGELIAIGMKERGCVGALVDGGVRDIRWFEYHGFPVFARYRSPVQSIGLRSTPGSRSCAPRCSRPVTAHPGRRAGGCAGRLRPDPQRYPDLPRTLARRRDLRAGP